MKLNYYDQSDGVQSMMKTRHDNDVIDHIGAIYTEIGTELWWSIIQDVVNHEKETGQRCDQSYWCELRIIQY